MRFNTKAFEAGYRVGNEIQDKWRQRQIEADYASETAKRAEANNEYAPTGLRALTDAEKASIDNSPVMAQMRAENAEFFKTPDDAANFLVEAKDSNGAPRMVMDDIAQARASDPSNYGLATPDLQSTMGVSKYGATLGGVAHTYANQADADKAIADYNSEAGQLRRAADVSQKYGLVGDALKMRQAAKEAERADEKWAMDKATHGLNTRELTAKVTAAERAQQDAEAQHNLEAAISAHIASTGQMPPPDVVRQWGVGYGASMAGINSVYSAASALDTGAFDYNSKQRVLKATEAMQKGGLPAMMELYDKDPLFADNNKSKWVPVDVKAGTGYVVKLSPGDHEIQRSPVGTQQEVGAFLLKHMENPVAALQLELAVRKAKADAYELESKGDYYHRPDPTTDGTGQIYLINKDGTYSGPIGKPRPVSFTETAAYHDKAELGRLLTAYQTHHKNLSVELESLSPTNKDGSTNAAYIAKVKQIRDVESNIADVNATLRARKYVDITQAGSSGPHPATVRRDADGRPIPDKPDSPAPTKHGQYYGFAKKSPTSAEVSDVLSGDAPYKRDYLQQWLDENTLGALDKQRVIKYLQGK